MFSKYLVKFTYKPSGPELLLVASFSFLIITALISLVIINLFRFCDPVLEDCIFLSIYPFCPDGIICWQFGVFSLANQILLTCRNYLCTRMMFKGDYGNLRTLNFEDRDIGGFSLLFWNQFTFIKSLQRVRYIHYLI